MKSMVVGLVALIVTLGMLAPTAMAHDIAKTYVAGLPTSFTPAEMQGHVPTDLVIADASGGIVSFAVCQDLDGNLLCGEQPNSNGVYEPWVEKCGLSAALNGSDPDHAAGAEPFSSTHEIHVIIRTLDPSCPFDFGMYGTLTLFTDP